MANFPQSLIISASEISSQDDSADRQFSVTGKSNFITRDQQKFGFDLTFSKSADRILARQNFAELCAFNFGGIQTTIVHPLYLSTTGSTTPAQSIQVSAPVSFGNTVSLKGFTASQPNVFRSGDFIRFNNHTKCYLVTSVNNNANSSGIATINIFPTLRTNIVTNEQLIFHQVEFSMHLNSSKPVEQKFTAPGTTRTQKITLVEWLS